MTKRETYDIMERAIMKWYKKWGWKHLELQKVDIENKFLSFHHPNNEYKQFYLNQQAYDLCLEISNITNQYFNLNIKWTFEVTKEKPQ